MIDDEIRGIRKFDEAIRRAKPRPEPDDDVSGKLLIAVFLFVIVLVVAVLVAPAFTAEITGRAIP